MCMHSPRPKQNDIRVSTSPLSPRCEAGHAWRKSLVPDSRGQRNAADTIAGHRALPSQTSKRCYVSLAMSLFTAAAPSKTQKLETTALWDRMHQGHHSSTAELCQATTKRKSTERPEQRERVRTAAQAQKRTHLHKNRRFRKCNTNTNTHARALD